jgi:amphi-Trp domain-containing protein
MEIFEDARTVSRADLAAWLRQMAGQLESDGKVRFGAAGVVTVGDEVHCELEIESSGSEMSIEIEFSWKGAAASGEAKVSAADAEEDAGSDDDADEDEDEGEEESGQGEEEAAAADSADAEIPAEVSTDVDEEHATPPPALAGSLLAPAAEPGQPAEDDKSGDTRPSATY